MNIKEARNAIEAILAAIPDDELPQFDRVDESSDGKPCVWWGGTGHVLGTATTGGKRDPLGYRRSGSWSAIEAEMTHRADRKLLEHGDDPSSLTFDCKTTAV